jgi:sigma-E factor negative regulatory protein RseB
MNPLRLVVPASTLCLFISFPACAANEAHEWLTRINRAARALNYEGIFVYQHGTQLETMRIVHRVNNGSVQERLVSLTGSAREVIRTDQEVRCYLPDQKSIVVEPRRLNRKSFPAILPDHRLPEIEQNYTIELGKPARVTGRAAQRLQIRPRDEYRYGYQLWADSETGLLLKVELTDNKGAVLEQFMFTQIQIGQDIPAAAVAAQTSEKGMVWHRDSEMPTSAKQSWRATRLPKGFVLSSTVVRKMPLGNRVVEQLVYSDGLAAVSVFVEKPDADAIAKQEGPSRMGALNALGRPFDGHYATVVGEVPIKTITMISNSLVPGTRQ